MKEHSGAYGMGVDYAYTMVHKAPERVEHGERIGPNPAKYQSFFRGRTGAGSFRCVPQPSGNCANKIPVTAIDSVEAKSNGLQRKPRFSRRLVPTIEL